MKSIIRNAQEHEAELLTELTLRSKASWGYDTAFMQSCREGLIIHASDIIDPLNVIHVIQSEVIEGFYFLRIKDSITAKLRFFFIDPPYQRKGLGSLLFEDVVSTGKERGIHSMLIESDPYAEGFYLKCGAVVIGHVSSESIQGRTLPLLEYRIEAV